MSTDPTPLHDGCHLIEPATVTHAEFSRLIAEGWEPSGAGVWTASGHQTLLRRDGHAWHVTINDVDGYDSVEPAAPDSDLVTFFIPAEAGRDAIAISPSHEPILPPLPHDDAALTEAHQRALIQSAMPSSFTGLVVESGTCRIGGGL